jgi:hypothetical protein
VADEEQKLYQLWAGQQSEVLAPPGLSLQLLATGRYAHETFNARKLRQGTFDGGRRALLQSIDTINRHSGSPIACLIHSIHAAAPDC